MKLFELHFRNFNQMVPFWRFQSKLITFCSVFPSIPMCAIAHEWRMLYFSQSFESDMMLSAFSSIPLCPIAHVCEEHWASLKVFLWKWYVVFASVLCDPLKVSYLMGICKWTWTVPWTPTTPPSQVFPFPSSYQINSCSSLKLWCHAVLNYNARD